MKGIDRALETDILVVGGSGAAVSAAVSARRHAQTQDRVTLVGKGKVGASGNAILAAAGISLDGPGAIDAGYDGDPSFTREVWYDQIIRDGFYLSDRRIVQRYVEEGPARVLELVRWGSDAGHYFHFHPSANFFTSGKAIGKALERGLSECSGIDVLEDVAVTDLLVGGGRCIGAVGVDIYTGDLISISARSVILCTGGFQPYSFRCTVSDMTGDGPAMALRAGARVSDMEFMLFLPGVATSPRIHRGLIFPGLATVLARRIPGFPQPKVVNGKGEDILEKIPPEARAMASETGWFKLLNTYYWYKEIHEGRGTEGNGVRYSFAGLDRDRLAEGFGTLDGLMRVWYRDRWTYQGEDCTDLIETALSCGSWEVGSSCEYSNGGVVVDEDGRTDLPGLFAAGEAAVGCFGAHRTHRALVEMLTTGASAGREAARGMERGARVEPDGESLSKCLDRLVSPLERERGEDVRAVRSSLEEAADRGFGPLRDGAGLAACTDRVADIRTQAVPAVSVKTKGRAYNPEWLEALSIENLALCLEAGSRAALFREESRGTHIRLDYPNVDHEQFLQRITFRMEGGQLLQGSISPDLSGVDPLIGDGMDVVGYAVECGRKMGLFDNDQN
ncbi:MAG: FAD-binding protein [Deltaproteobacteria bacterium]|nr:FAD-binding protein [Candidatus Zymogenaceae bacterium]